MKLISGRAQLHSAKNIKILKNGEKLWVKIDLKTQLQRDERRKEKRQRIAKIYIRGNTYKRIPRFEEPRKRSTAVKIRWLVSQRSALQTCDWLTAFKLRWLDGPKKLWGLETWGKHETVEMDG